MPLHGVRGMPCPRLAGSPREGAAATLANATTIGRLLESMAFRYGALCRAGAVAVRLGDS